MHAHRDTFIGIPSGPQPWLVVESEGRCCYMGLCGTPNHVDSREWDLIGLADSDLFLKF